MFVQQLFEGTARRVIVVYPGRFQPFHLGHKEVFEALQAKFGSENVYIGTSNKVSQPKSPFNFSEKLQLINAAGIPSNHVIEVVNTYQPGDYINAIGFDPTQTIMIFAVGEPDLARLEVDATYTEKTPTGRPSKIPPGKQVGDPKPFKSFQSVDQSLTADQHQYVMIVKERPKTVSVNGKTFDASHGTQVRELWNQVRNDPKASAEVMQQLYGKATPEVAHILNQIQDVNAPAEPVAKPSPKLTKVAETSLDQGVAEGLFGINDKTKAKIQHITSLLSDVPGMWDHKAQTFTVDGRKRLDHMLNFNEKYIKYALNLTYKDYEDMAEGSGGAKYKIKSIGKDKNGDYYISPNTGKKVYKQAKVGDHETPSGEVKPKVAEGADDTAYGRHQRYFPKGDVYNSKGKKIGVWNNGLILDPTIEKRWEDENGYEWVDEIKRLASDYIAQGRWTVAPEQGVAEGFGRNRGYSHGFASPHAPSLGGRREREDDEGYDQEEREKTQNWYIRIDGKLLKDKQQQPYTFRGKAAAEKAARTMMAKDFNRGKKFTLTTSWMDAPKDMDESKKKDTGINKDDETKFHAKLDKLVHDTFGKRKAEKHMAEDDHSKHLHLHHKKNRFKTLKKIQPFEADMDESLYQYDKQDPYNSEFAPDVGMGRMTLRGWKQSMIRRVKEFATELERSGGDLDRDAMWDHVYKKLQSLNLDPIAQEIEAAHQELDRIRKQGGIRSRAFKK